MPRGFLPFDIIMGMPASIAMRAALTFAAMPPVAVHAAVTARGGEQLLGDFIYNRNDRRIGIYMRILTIESIDIAEDQQ